MIRVEISIHGGLNEINISEGCRLDNVKIIIRGDCNEILIHKGVKFNRGSELWFEDKNCSIEIGQNTTFENVHLAVTEPDSKIIIGPVCMFAYDIDVRTGDSHSIIDLETNKRINYAKSVIIGTHVWVASHCSILKGVNLPNNTIVASRSLVSKTFDKEGIIKGGSPAKIIKENFTWKRERIYEK